MQVIALCDRYEGSLEHSRLTIENVKKLSSEYCNLLQDVTNEKYNLVIVGNIRQNKELERCLKRHLQMWDAWTVFEDAGDLHLM